MDSRVAQGLARKFLSAIGGQIDQGEVAGAVRRGEPTTKKIVIVACASPGRPPVEWGTAAKDQHATYLDKRLAELRASGKIAPNPIDKAMGPKQKNYILSAMNIALELHICKPDEWGWVLAMQTGDARFWRQTITKVGKGGLMPDDARLYGGTLDSNTLGRVSCLTEATFFQFLGFDWVPAPAERTITLAQEMHRELRAREGGTARAEEQGGNVYTVDAEMDHGGTGGTGSAGDRTSWQDA